MPMKPRAGPSGACERGHGRAAATARAMKLLVLGLALAATPAFAQGGAEQERPWAKGVPQAKQEKAFALFRDGNAALKESLFVKAAQIYREALASWDHPAIHYNLALALVNLDQPLETHEHLLAALKYGASPLDSDKYEQALRYKALVEKQLAKIEIRCETEGAVVKLDGIQVLTGPGVYTSLVRAGGHTLVASKEGFLTSEQSDSLPGNSSKVFEFKLKSSEELTEYRRRWPNYQPWLVVGGGVLLAGVSVGLHLAARNQFKVYDNGITACVKPETGGCNPSVALTGTRSGGETMQAVAMVGYAVGTAALITGAVLVWMNRLLPYRQSVNVEPSSPSVTLVPQLGPNPGAALFVSF